MTKYHHRHYLYSAASLIAIHRPTISNFSFERSFHPQSRDGTPQGLNLFPIFPFPREKSNSPQLLLFIRYSYFFFLGLNAFIA